MRGTFAISSHLAVKRDELWQAVSSMQGVNAELAPWFRMTHPRGLVRLEGEIPLGKRLFRSWLLLLRLVPVDYDDLTLVRVEAGIGFREESTMATMRVWVHERTLAASGVGTLLEDRLEFEPRVAATLPLLRRVVSGLFRHRHARLRARYGKLAEHQRTHLDAVSGARLDPSRTLRDL